MKHMILPFFLGLNFASAHSLADSPPLTTNNWHLIEGLIPEIEDRSIPPYPKEDPGCGDPNQGWIWNGEAWVPDCRNGC